MTDSIQDVTARTMLAGVSTDERSFARDRHLTVVSSALVGLYLVFWLSGVLHFALRQFPDSERLVRLPYYLLYGMGLATAIYGFAREAEYRRRFVMLALLSGALLLPVSWGAECSGSACRSYIAGIAALFIFSTLSLQGEGRRLGQLAASVVALSSLFVLADAAAPRGLSLDLWRWRAASFYLNPNEAAITLMLGAVGSVWSVSPRWRIGFLLLVAIAVIATVSRGFILVGAAALLASIPLLAAEWGKHRVQLAAGFWPALGGGIVVAAALGLAATQSPEVMRKLEDANQRVLSIYSHFKNKIAALPESTSQTPRAESGRSNAKSGNPFPTRDSSATTREFRLDRAVNSYLSRPMVGHGIDRAYALDSENSYALLGVAFGFVGWLLIPALCGFILSIAGWRVGLPAATMIALASLLFQGLLVNAHIIASLVVVISGLFALREQRADISDALDRSVLRSFAVIAASLCVVVLILSYAALLESGKGQELLAAAFSVIILGWASFWILACRRVASNRRA